MSINNDSKKPRLLFVVNSDTFFVTHRLPIAREAIQSGYEIHIATTISNDVNTLHAQGMIVHPLYLNRFSAGIISNIITFFQFLYLFVTIKPQIIHLITIKPTILGGVAARIACMPCVVAAISGLGYVFVSHGFLATTRRWLVSILYRLALGHPNIKIIFQNENDRNTLIKLTKIPMEKTVMIHGSGVDLSRYYPTPLPQGIPVIMFASRLLVNKGVREFVQAARILKSTSSITKFVLVGQPDFGNPDSITVDEIKQWVKDGIIEDWGYHRDMPKILAQSHVVVLPSYYGEGLPKILIEAAACGRAIITTDHPGCKDAIEPDKTGILVPTCNLAALVTAIKLFLDNPTLCAEMGKSGRILAESKFDIHDVVLRHMKIYEKLLQTF